MRAQSIFNHMVERLDSPPAEQPGLDRTLAALADPTRRALIEELRHGPIRVTDLAAPLPMSLNAVSKHIKVLERAGLVTRERAGREHRLAFRPEALEPAAIWIEEMRAFWNARLDALDAALRAEDDTAEQQSKGAPT